MALLKKKRQRLFLAIGAVTLGLAVAGGVFFFMPNSFAFFVTPTELAAQPRPPGERLRIGGMVVEGSLKKGKINTFRLTDFETEIEVRFEGVLPDLIKDGQGAVADGHLVDGVFVADEVLAKHDEKYMPAEIEDRVRKAKAAGSS